MENSRGMQETEVETIVYLENDTKEVVVRERDWGDTINNGRCGSDNWKW